MSVVGGTMVRWYKKLDGTIPLQYARQVYRDGQKAEFEWVDVPVVEEVAKAPEEELPLSLTDYACVLFNHERLSGSVITAKLLGSIFSLDSRHYNRRNRISLGEAVVKIYENTYQVMHSVTEGFTKPVLLTDNNLAGQQTRLMHNLENQYPDWIKRPDVVKENSDA